ncbi:MAG TPA: restriction endonuclease subunit S [Streptosporangiaceae bacterium]|nr:restriction endonuclease subunit S [Streptosporangiaceae bacterium]
MSAPSTWTRTRVDRVATVSARIGWKALTANEYEPEGYVFLATPNIKSTSIDFDNVNYISQFRFEESPELKLEPKDVLLVKDGNTLGITNIVCELPRPATVNGSIAVLRAFGIESRFLRYSLASTPTQELIDAIKGGMGVPHLFQWDIRRLPLDLPPFDEQCRIADFLDAESARIDHLSKLLDYQLRLLDMRRRNHLAKEAEALGKRYGQVRVRHVLRKIEQGWSPPCEDRLAVRDEWGVVKAGCVNGGVFNPGQHKALPVGIQPDLRYRLRPGDLLMSRASGSTELIGSIAVLPDNLSWQLLLCDKVYRLYLDRTRMIPNFVAFILRSQQAREQIRLGISGAEGMANNLPTATVTNLLVPNVPLIEQGHIVADLENSSHTTSETIRLLKKQLVLLAERRQALITAAVTGQIDVTTARGVIPAGGVSA